MSMKTEKILSANNDGYIYAEQLKKLLQLYDADTENEKLIYKIYANVYNKENLELIYSTIRIKQIENRIR
ncbi:MAG: hypothetical protein R2771_11505 [Saprospiraceae bacterium]